MPLAAIRSLSRWRRSSNSPAGMTGRSVVLICCGSRGPKRALEFGEPEPPRILSGAAMKKNRGGSPSRAARFSIMRMPLRRKLSCAGISVLLEQSMLRQSVPTARTRRSRKYSAASRLRPGHSAMNSRPSVPSFHFLCQPKLKMTASPSAIGPWRVSHALTAVTGRSLGGASETSIAQAGPISALAATE